MAPRKQDEIVVRSFESPLSLLEQDSWNKKTVAVVVERVVPQPGVRDLQIVHATVDLPIAYSEEPLI